MRYPFFILCLCALLSCNSDNDSVPQVTGQAGSYARMLPIGDFLYSVDQSGLHTLSLQNGASPTPIDHQVIGSNIESVFHFGKHLFIGSGSGMYIYQIGSDGIPQERSAALYNFPVEPCDPIVANDSVAYVTLSSIDINSCGNISQASELRIYDITNLDEPEYVRSYNDFFNPKGMGLDGKYLFVCDDKNGLFVFEIINRNELRHLHRLTDLNPYDVIADDGLLIVIESNRVTQIDYTSIEDLKILSSLTF